MKSDYVGWQISFNPRLILGFHLNEVKISSAKADFITVGDFIFFRRPYNQAKRDDELVRQRASVDCSANVLQRAKQVRSTALQKAKFAKSIYFSPFLWYNTTNR